MPGYEYTLAQMSLRKVRAQHSKDMSLAMFINAEGEVKYLISQKVTEIIRKAVKSVYPDIPKEELTKYSTCSIRAWKQIGVDVAEHGSNMYQQVYKCVGK